MPIEKYRSVEDMPPVPPLPAGAERARRLHRLWAGWARLLPPLDLQGVRRYRSLEEADADREAAVRQRMRNLARSRARPARGRS